MEDNTLTTIGAVAIVAVVGAGLILNQQSDPAPQVDQAKSEQPQTETYFAQVDKNGTVLQVIVADQEFINSGAVGDPSSWVQTFKDGGSRAKYAGKGYKLDKNADVFVVDSKADVIELSATSSEQVP